MSSWNHKPLLRVTWTDPVTGRVGYLVIHSLVSGLTTGGTRMRAGCALAEVEDLARGMALKAAVFDLPVGGAKGGIDCSPKDPEARGMLRRFLQAMRPWLDTHWVTAEDLGVPQHLIDEIFDELGLGQSYHAAIRRAADPAATLSRVRAGLWSPLSDDYRLGDVVGGYGVAQSCLGVAHVRGWTPSETTVAIQGVGTMGGAAAKYLYEAGLQVVAVADALGTLYHPNGLDIPTLLDARDTFGEIDRTRVPDPVTQLPREAVLSVGVDILVPAAISYAINLDNVGDVKTRLIVEAANAATTPQAEAELISRGIPVIPDFVANAGAVIWAWWLLLGRVDDNPTLTFTSLRQTMLATVAPLITAWDVEQVPPRTTALQRASQQTDHYAAAEQDGRVLVTIP